MKRLSLIVLVIILAAVYSPAQQSLADAARAQRAADKKAAATHVYTNDDIAVPKAASEKADAGASTPAATDADATAKPDANAGASAKSDTAKADAAKPADKKDDKEAAAKAAEAFKQKISDQQKAIADQERELSISEREHQIRVAEYYADAGTQLRTSGQWFEQEKKYNEDLDAKKKAIADAKSKLDELNEQARKAGISASSGQ